jgi:hypothetical protein
MSKQIRMRAVRRKQIDDEKLALAFLLLAKILNVEAAAREPSKSTSLEKDA